MARTITHFMWGYQEHFRLNVQFATRRICQALGLELHPRTFLVGVRINDDEARHAACVEPEQDHWAESARLYDALQDVDGFLKSYPESRLCHSHPIAQANESRRLFHRAVRDAVKLRLDNIADKPADSQLFVSDPTERDGFLVMTVIEVDRATLAQIPSVDDNTIKIHEFRSFPVPRNLLEAAINVLFSEIAYAILEPDAGAGLENIGSTDELLQKAGLRFFAGLVRRIDEDAIYAGLAEKLFDSIVRLSLTPYERAEAQGLLVFAQKDKTVGAHLLQLHEPVPFESFKAVRKLLAMSRGANAWRCNVNAVFSLIDRRTMSSVHRARTLDVEVIGRGQWQASLDDRQLMVVKDGLPRLPTPTVDHSRIRGDLRRLIPEMTEEVANRLAAIATSLADSGHGAILAITPDAGAEASRMANDSLPVTPLPLSAEMAMTLSQIDGAILCDDKGNCHAIGVILDGQAVESGDRGRGSRYNSSLRYVLARDKRAILVVSEDGGLDLLPKLVPAISNSLLIAKIEELETFVQPNGAVIRREKEAALIEWLEKHRFYLTQAQCDHVNALIRACDKHWRAQSDNSIWIERVKLRPDSAFRAERDLLP